jgi:hypothetical protein
MSFFVIGEPIFYKSTSRQTNVSFFENDCFLCLFEFYIKGEQV